MNMKKNAAFAAIMMLWTTASYAATASVSVGFGQPVTSVQQQAGGAAVSLNAGDTVLLNTTILTDATFASPLIDTNTIAMPLDSTSTVPATAEGTAPAQSAAPAASQQKAAKKEVTSGSIAIASYYSPYLKLYSVPISWTFFDKLKTELSLPYIDRTLKQDGVKYSANGIGDMSLGFDYSIINDGKWDVSTILGATFPTGDVEAKASKGGKTITVPLGSGAYSINLTQNGSYNYTPEVRLFGSATFRYFTDADYTYYATSSGTGDRECLTGNEPFCKKHEERGVIISGLIGSEYKFRDDMSVTGRFSVVDVEGGKQSFDGKAMVSSNDSLIAGDVSLTWKWRFWRSATAALTGIIPVFTRFDSNAINPEERTWGVSGAFLTKF